MNMSLLQVFRDCHCKYLLSVLSEKHYLISFAFLEYCFFYSGIRPDKLWSA
jgi:hypothetical protein